MITKQKNHENKKKHYPPMSEILKTGRYFASAEWQSLKPYINNNTAFVSASAATSSSQSFDWGYNSAPLFRLGFESIYGPGAELDYWQYDQASNISTATSDGITTATTTIPLEGSPQFGILSATNPGESLLAQHHVEIHSLGLSFFKDMKLPISRVGGSFGLRYVSLAQNANVTLLDSSQTEIGNMQHITDFRGFGPRMKVEYYRPIGHTKLESIGSFGGSLLFGNRDQYVDNSTVGHFIRTNADEVITVFDALLGVQYVRSTGENRSFYARLAMVSQSWIGGGTAISIDENFGFRGVAFTLGLNR